MAYALALGLVALVLGARTLLAPTLGNQALYLFLVPSVLIAGIVGGWGPGLLATFLSLILHLYLTGEYLNLFDRNSPLFAAELSRAVTFTLMGIGIAWFGERLRSDADRGCCQNRRSSFTRSAPAIDPRHCA